MRGHMNVKFECKMFVIFLNLTHRRYSNRYFNLNILLFMYRV